MKHLQNTVLKPKLSVWGGSAHTLEEAPSTMTTAKNIASDMQWRLCFGLGRVLCFEALMPLVWAT